ncbi:MAG: glycoside hydrolase family 9 protein [Candidatus Goldbacteria bacterium]|nr:glycoside hydrolase family 9 protein [Candidatus Goldiibacteriota bacterium]
MKELTLLCFFIFMMSNMSYTSEKTEIGVNVMIDQNGYKTNENKYVIVTSPSKNYTIKRSNDNRAVFWGELKGPISDYDSGDNCYVGDFSKYNVPGKYYIDTEKSGRSYDFVIGNDVLKNPLYKVLRGFYLQRCGIEVKDPSGVGHPACHLRPAKFHPGLPEKGEVDVTGGWHDAGDYGKYVVNSGISTATLLYAYERYPSKLKNFKFDVTKTDDALPDVLAEAKWNVDWMLKMQRKDGAVYHKVTTELFPEMQKKAEEDNAQQYVYEISTTATGDFAAVMAIAARIYRDFDLNFSEKCLDAAEKAWKYLYFHSELIPSSGFKNPAGTNTGQYSDGFDGDERFWAATELFLTTGKETYKDYILKNYSNREPVISSPAYWWEVYVLAFISYLYSDRQDKDKELVEKIKSDLEKHADALLDRIEHNGYKYVLEEKDYIWGSNSVALNYAINLLVASEMLNNGRSADYRQGAMETIHYLFGRNPFSKSYVTGIGRNCVKNIHHRPSVSDNIDEPYPGLLAGGPNMKKSDPVLRQLSFDTPPAKCFVDDTGSYASNEIAINWNAPLVYVLAGLM